jgi:hypothetical protein
VNFGQLTVCAALVALTGCAGLDVSRNGVFEGRRQADDIAGLVASGPACFRGIGPQLPSGAGLEQRGVNPLGALFRLTEDSIARLRPRTIRAAKPPAWRHGDVDTSRSGVDADLMRRF